jgi:hypothetical protein
MTQPSGIALFANGNPDLLAEVPAGYTGLAFDQAGNPLVRRGTVNERLQTSSIELQNSEECSENLAPDHYTIRRDGDDLYIDVNIAGQIKYVFIGTAVPCAIDPPDEPVGPPD